MGSVVEHADALVQSADQDVILLKVKALDGFFEVADASVNDFGGRTRSSPGKVAGLDHHRSDAAQLRIQSACGSGSSASDDAQLKLLVGDVG